MKYLLGLSIMAIFAIALPTVKTQKNLIIKRSCEMIKTATVKGNSMIPRLKDGQAVRIAWDYYDCHSFQREDIVVVFFPSQEHPFIKTLYGLPGDKITFNKGKLAINNKVLKNSMEDIFTFDRFEIQQIKKALNEEQKIKPNNFIILGDNIFNKFSSRKFGPVFQDQIVGKVLEKNLIN